MSKWAFLVACEQAQAVPAVVYCGALAATDKLRTGVGASVDELAEDDADELGNWP